MPLSGRNATSELSAGSSANAKKQCFISDHDEACSLVGIKLLVCGHPHVARAACSETYIDTMTPHSPASLHYPPNMLMVVLLPWCHNPSNLPIAHLTNRFLAPGRQVGSLAVLALCGSSRRIQGRRHGCGLGNNRE